jgi:hypothetical protein
MGTLLIYQPRWRPQLRLPQFAHHRVYQV